jgi:cardiolipin synthase A/B
MPGKGQWMSGSKILQRSLAQIARGLLPGGAAHSHVPPGGKPWRREKLYFRGDDYYRDLLAAIQRARHSVDFETYIFEAGLLGDQMVEAFVKARRRGVRVRVLVDGVGSADFASHYGPRLKKGRVQFRIYRSWDVFFHTLFQTVGFKRFGVMVRAIADLWAGGKRRDHRKQCVVDNNRVWVGGFNVSDWHLESVKGKEAWRDTGLGLWGVRTLVFRLAFHITWEDRWPGHLRRLYRNLLIRWLSHDILGSPVRVTATRHLRRGFRKELLERIGSTKKRLWVTTPYFVPTRLLMRAIVDAARQGRDVRLVLPGVSDVPMVRWASMVFYAPLLRAGGRIFEYQKRVLHAKTLLVDAWPLVGSSNLNHRSLLQDLEINVIPQEKESLRELERQFRIDRGKSREVTLEDIQGRPPWVRLLSWLFFQFRYWL